MVNRVLRDDPSKGDMHNRMGITPKRLWYAITDYDLWPVSALRQHEVLKTRNWLTSDQIYLLGLIIYIPVNPPSTYLTLTLRNLGFSTVGHEHRPAMWSLILNLRRLVRYKSPDDPVDFYGYLYADWDYLG